MKMKLLSSKKAADLGDAESMKCLVAHYESGKYFTENSEKAFEYYQKAAENDLPYTVFALSSYYKNGKHAKQDYSMAFSYYKRAINLGR